MATIDHKLIRILLIYRKLSIEPETTREELCTVISQGLNARGYKSDISLSTIKRDLNELRALGVDITYDHKGRRYNVASTTDWSEFLSIVPPLKVLTAMGQDSGVPEYIFPERYESKGLQHLDAITTAIRRRHTITFDHHKYRDGSCSERTLRPEVLKEW